MVERVFTSMRKIFPRNVEVFCAAPNSSFCPPPSPTLA